MEARANRLAHHLADQGVGPGDHVGIYAYNSVEWVETLWAVFKIRAVWVNINYRYVEEELAYLFDNADLTALVHDREFVSRIDAVRADAPKLKAFVSIVFDHCFVVTDLKVIHGPKGLFVSMPSKKRKDGTFKDIAHPLNNQMRQYLEEKILGVYKQQVAVGASPAAHQSSGEAAAKEGSQG